MTQNIKNNKEVKVKRKENFMKILFIIIYLVLTVAGLILYKKGANSDFVLSIENNVLNVKLSLISIIGLICYLLSFLMYMLILPKFDLTFIYPLMTAISYISIYILSIFMLGEKVTLLGIIGSIIIMIGIFIVNIGK